MIAPPDGYAAARDRLEARREELLALRRRGDDPAASVELDQARQGRLSRMDALQQQAMAQAAQRRQDRELRRITVALRRVDSGEYGCCVDCGEEIAAARLAFDPAVARCVRCAEGQATD